MCPVIFTFTKILDKFTINTMSPKVRSSPWLYVLVKTLLPHFYLLVHTCFTNPRCLRRGLTPSTDDPSEKFLHLKNRPGLKIQSLFFLLPLFTLSVRNSSYFSLKFLTQSVFVPLQGFLLLLFYSFILKFYSSPHPRSQPLWLHSQRSWEPYSERFRSIFVVTPVPVLQLFPCPVLTVPSLL